MTKEFKEMTLAGYRKRMTRIGFCFDSLNMDQSVYTCIYNTNIWLESNFGTDFSIFGTEPLIPEIRPHFARYYIEDIGLFQGNIICSTVDSAIRTRCASMSKVFFYIQDIYEIRSFADKHQEFIDLMTDKNIVKFARSNDIVSHYQNRGFEIYNKRVEDYNIKEILEIINGHKG